MIELLLQAEGALSVGLLDRAEVLYQQVAGADPRNSIAVVGLARVALERSDEVGALTLARRALTIDPQNDAAARMVQRLEEVLRHRGTAMPPPTAEPGRAAGAAPEPEPAPDTDPAPEPDRAPEPDLAPGSELDLGPAPEPAPAPAGAAEAAAPEPAPEPDLAPGSELDLGPAPEPDLAPEPRSYLDRLLRRRWR